MKILRGGLQTSFQDLGRRGFMHQGVSISGAMDADSLKLANWLVGNDLNQVALEVTLIGPTIEFEESMQIAVCGAHFELSFNETLIKNGRTISVKPGDRLEFKKLLSGARAYLSFSSNPELKESLGSYSTHLTANFGGFKGRPLKDGDEIKFGSRPYTTERKLPPELISHYSGNYLLRCTASVESEALEKYQADFFNRKFKVSADSNRMGVRLIGTPLDISQDISIQSSGLTPGSIQIPPSGLPIISSVDGQTTGGYPRIANVISCDHSILGQLRANDIVSFCLVSLEQAKKLLIDKSRYLKSTIFDLR